MYNSYRPQYAAYAHNYDPPPPPPPEMPPMPPPRVFGGDSYRPGERYPHSGQYAQRNEFTFSVNGHAPAYPAESERNGNNHRPAQRREPYRGRGRGRGGRFMAAERPLMHAKQGDQSQEVLGTRGGSQPVHKYLALDAMTDSEDEPMDESQSEEEGPSLQHSATHDGSDEAIEPPRKRRIIAKDLHAASAIPKWSNPDPYTVLPPVDEEQRKNKNVVKLIRKARVATERDETTQTEVAANNDFISFDNEDEGGSDAIGAKILGDLDVSPGPRHLDPPQRHQNGIPSGVRGPQGSLPDSMRRSTPPGLQTNAPVQLPPKPVGNASIRPDGTENLGSCKRTFDDEIKPAAGRPPLPKKSKGDPSNGSLVRDWLPFRDQDPTPWLVRSPYQTEHPGFRLHKEICDFYEFVRPRPFEQTIREDLLHRLQKAVRHDMPECDVHCFGSFAAGLYLPNADMDVVVISRDFRETGEKIACQSKSKMYKFSHYLENTVAEQGSIEVIAKAKVPIIKFVDRITAIRVDVSFENETGIIANETFLSWKQQFPAMPVLVTIIKQFLMIRGLNDVSGGGLGGFSVTCLVTSLLQNMPRVQLGEIIPEHHLGEMLIEFLDFYGNQLDIGRVGITMDPPGYFDKIASSRNMSVYQENRNDRLAIIDPNKPSNDISGGSRNVSLIFDRFSRAHEELLDALRSTTRISLLDWMLGGNYENFDWQRNHLRDLYQRRWGNLKAESLPQQWTRRDYDYEAPNEDFEVTRSSIITANEPHAPKDKQSTASDVIATNELPIIPKKGNESSKQRPKAKKPSKKEIKASCIARAKTLKKRYPDMNVPDAVGRKEMKTMIEKYNETKSPITRSKAAKAAVKTKAVKKPRKPRNKNKDGTSKNPIAID